MTGLSSLCKRPNISLCVVIIKKSLQRAWKNRGLRDWMESLVKDNHRTADGSRENSQSDLKQPSALPNGHITIHSHTLINVQTQTGKYTLFVSGSPEVKTHDF